jgi:Zn-dependent protease with chaperone function
MREDEILYVMGHEMGHYALGHVWRGIAVSAAICLVMFFLAGRITAVALGRYGRAWGVPSIDDVSSMPLLYAALTAVTFVVVPAFHAYTRSVETEADLYGLELTHDNDAAARAFVKLGSNNKSNPEPSEIVKFMLFSHPPDGERVRRALSYRPWAEGRPNRYFKEKS